MATHFWKQVRSGTPSARAFSAYLVLVLAVAVIGPGLAVYASEGNAPVAPPAEVVEPIDEVGEPTQKPEAKPEPVVEPDPVEVPEPVAEPEPVVEPVASAAEQSKSNQPVTPEPVMAPMLSAVVTPLALSSDPSDLGIVPETVSGNPKLCIGGIRVNNGTPGSYPIPGYPGMFVTVSVASTDDGPVFSFSSDVPVARVVAKGGNIGANVYYYDPAVTADGKLHTPVNPSGFYAGISHIDFCFGEIPDDPKGELVVYKFHDLDEDGVYDDGEPMLEDWEFTLTQSTPPIVTTQAIQLIDSGLTDENGELLFSDLALGKYTVTETLQDGWINTTPLSQDVTVVEDETAHVWFGNAQIPDPEGDLVVYKFHDLDEDGVYDEGEPMLEDWEFTLTDGETEIDSGLTDASGELLFGSLVPGEYTVTETLEDGWTNTTPLSQDVTVVDGQTVSLWFGNVEEFLPFTELDLAITKAVDKKTADPGDLLTYTLTYWNTSDVVAYGFTITDDFDERYVTVVDAAGGAVANGKIVWNMAGPLAEADGKQTITYTVRVVEDMPNGTTNVDNVVVIRHPDDSDPSNNTDDARTVVRVSDEEPFLPFTGGEYLLLIGLAALAASAGALLRLRGNTAA